MSREWEALHGSGSQALIVQCDTSEERHITRLLAHVQAALPPLTGVFHAAGVLVDSLLPKQSADGMCR
eukprot:2787998-Prymnesium_polylepis.1